MSRNCCRLSLCRDKRLSLPWWAVGVMDDIDLPAGLLEDFKHTRVVLFVGAGCSKNAGLPDWAGLLRRICDVYEKEGLLDEADLESIERWWHEADGFPQIAELFKKKAPEPYRRIMQSIFDPDPYGPQLRTPKYFHWFQRLPLTRILTTNFDLLLEQTLGPCWSHLSWNERQDIPRYLRDPRPLIFHVHGRADRYTSLVHTEDEYRLHRGPDGSVARKFLRHLFETHTILALGYRLGDPVIRWLYDQLLKDWGVPPSWYALTPDPAPGERRREREQRQLRLVSYPLAGDLDADQSHEESLNQWFGHLCRELDITLPDQVSSGGTTKTSPVSPPVTISTTRLVPVSESPYPLTQTSEHPGESNLLPSTSTERTHEPDGSTLVRIPSGEYILGADDMTSTERPQHCLYLTEFWIAKFPVTNAQYQKFLECNSSQTQPLEWKDQAFRDLDQPVVGVSWEDTWAYCAWAGLMLPSEAQWEAAARGTDGRTYPWGNGPPTPERANFGKRVANPLKVGACLAGASPFGVLDMAGNVWEWCADVWDPDAYQQRNGTVDPVASTGGVEARVMRGGSWLDEEERFLKAAYRIHLGRADRKPFIGFRVCLFDSSA